MRLSRLIAATVLIGSGPAYAQELSFEQDTGPGRMTTVRVAPTPEGRYGSVVDDELTVHFLVRGATVTGVPPNVWKPESFEAWIADGRTEGKLSDTIADSLTINWKPFALTFPYHAPFRTDVGNATLDPVQLCNQLLDNSRGSDRARFLQQGGSASVHNAYPLKGHGVYLPNTRLARHRQYNAEAGMSLQVRCLPIAAEGQARVRRGTRTGDEGKRRAADRARGAPDIVQSLGFDIAASDWGRVGNQSCPVALTLRGRLTAGREANVTAAFVGTGFVSPVERLALTPGQSYSFERVYPVKWETPQVGGLAAAPTALRSQRVTLRLNVARGNRTILASEERVYEATCRQVRSPPPPRR